MADIKSLNIDLAKFNVKLRAEVTHKPGAILLSGYPLLVYAPGQHGPGIRLEDHGTPVADVAAKVSEMPEYSRLAAHFGTSEEHVRQALAYVLAAHDVNPGTVAKSPVA